MYTIELSVRESTKYFLGQKKNFFGCLTCTNLVAQPGIETAPSALEAWHLNHCTAREVPKMDFYFFKALIRLTEILYFCTNPNLVLFIWNLLM